MNQIIIGIDQDGYTFQNLGKYPRKELLKRLGYTHAEKMYIDDKNGEAYHIGYIIGGRWITLYELSEIRKKA